MEPPDKKILYMPPYGYTGIDVDCTLPRLAGCDHAPQTTMAPTLSDIDLKYYFP